MAFSYSSSLFLLLPYLLATMLITTPSSTTASPAMTHYTTTTVHTTTETASSPVPKRSDFPPKMNFFAAAACCARGPACWDRHARNSVFCVRHVWMSAQSIECQRAACFYCMRRNADGAQVNRQKPVCRALALLKNCFGVKPPYPRPPKRYMPPSPSPRLQNGGGDKTEGTKMDPPMAMPEHGDMEDPEAPILEAPPPQMQNGDTEPEMIKRNPPSPSPRPKKRKKPQPKPQPKPKRHKKNPRSEPQTVQDSAGTVPGPHPPSSGKNCATYAGLNGRVVIPARGMGSGGKWRRTHQGKAITWKPYGGAGIDKPDDGNSFCVQFVPDTSAMYYFTVLSSAPHPTEHNDAWFRFPSGKGFYRYRPQSKSVMPPSTNWLKGYQNDGGNSVANYILNEDFDGHQLMTPFLVRGNKYKVCVAGRSSKFAIYKMALVACPPETADEWPKNAASCSRFGKPIATVMSSLAPSECLLGK